MIKQTVGFSCEVWLRIQDYPNYEISSEGRIRRATPGKGTAVGRILKQSQTGGRDLAYMQVNIRGVHGKRTLLVHILVARAFLGSQAGMDVHHVDTDSTHNAATNLEWVTHSYNIFQSWQDTRRPAMYGENFLADQQAPG